MQFGQYRFILYTTVRLRIHQRYVTPSRSIGVRTTGTDCRSAAKRGSVPLLAVATEQGKVYVWDTSKREELGRGQ